MGPSVNDAAFPELEAPSYNKLRLRWGVALSIILHLCAFFFLAKEQPNAGNTEQRLSITIKARAAQEIENPVPKAALPPEKSINEEKQRNVVTQSEQATSASTSSTKAMDERILISLQAEPDSTTQNTQDTPAIFDPRLRKKYLSSPNLPSQQNNSEAFSVHNMRYYDVGSGCIREHVDGLGINERDDETYLMMNVKKVKCPGDETEGEAILRGLRAALPPPKN